MPRANRHPPEQVDGPPPKPPRFRNPIFRFIGGLKFGLTLLALLIIASSWGESLPQNTDDPSQPNLAIDLVFGQWWYRLLLLSLAVNLICNTLLTYVDETYPQFLPSFRSRPDHFQSLKIKHKVGFKATRASDSEGLMCRLAEAFRARGYRGYFTGDSFYGHRGLIARFGSTVTHIGLITILFGALTESFLKKEATVQMYEGQVVSTYHLEKERRAAYAAGDPMAATHHPFGFDIHCNDFEFTEYPGTGSLSKIGRGIASKFKTTLTFIKDGEQDVHDYVRVNHSIRYGGWKLHQSSYITDDNDEYLYSIFLHNLDRYYVELSGPGPEGRRKNYRFEILRNRAEAYDIAKSLRFSDGSDIADIFLIDPPAKGLAVVPLPGRDDLFFSLEEDTTGKGLIWTVASKEKVLARGGRSHFGDLRIEMLEFYHDLEVDPVAGPHNKTDQPNEPVALIEISSDNKVILRKWVFFNDPAKHDPSSDPDSLFDLVMTDYEILPGTGGHGVTGAAAMIDGAALASAEEPTPGADPESAIVTIALKNPKTGRTFGKPYRLAPGNAQPLADGVDPAYDIPGDYDVQVLKKIPVFATVLSVSRNPGIPIVWLGAIFASLGPVLAFFISRRRVWAHVDWNKKTFWIGGDSRYSREALTDEIAEVVGQWSHSDEVRITPEIKLKSSGSAEVLSRYL